MISSMAMSQTSPSYRECRSSFKTKENMEKHGILYLPLFLICVQFMSILPVEYSQNSFAFAHLSGASPTPDQPHLLPVALRQLLNRFPNTRWPLSPELQQRDPLKCKYERKGFGDFPNALQIQHNILNRPCAKQNSAPHQGCPQPSSWNLSIVCVMAKGVKAAGGIKVANQLTLKTRRSC